MADPATPDAVGTELATLKVEQADLRSAYHVGPQADAKQARYRELLTAQETGAAPPAVSAQSAEISAIKAKMADVRSEYWIGPQAEALQARYRLLLDAEAGNGIDPEARDDWRASPAAVRQSLDPALVTEWGQAFDANLTRVQDAGARVVGALGDRMAQGDFLNTFEGLAAKTKSAIYREIARPAPSDTVPANEADMAYFRRQAGADQILELWGSEASRRVGVALDRFQRIDRSLPTAERDEFADTWKRITPRERQLVLWSMG